ncbi:SUMF1/EgtB/PvdO family nonheme iron enzyme [Nostoc sp.]|uniref:SUMF1/EgtB/PvdO family nonheme iron enzyme n=1 Tax=Nostoc sp. TaxID=1180 RepID=UPI002FF5CF66
MINQLEAEKLTLTIVQMDLVKSSRTTSDLFEIMGEQGVLQFTKELEKDVTDAFNPIKESLGSEYDQLHPLGGDGYRISFEKVENAYKFVKTFCKKLNTDNKTRKEYQRIFRIGIATGNVMYNKSKQCLDKIIGHSVLFTVARLSTGKPGWLYIDEETFNKLQYYEDLIRDFVETTVKGKEHEDDITAYCCEIIRNSPLKSFNFQRITYNNPRDRKPRVTSDSAEYFTETLVDSVKLDMVFIKNGKFEMGTTDGQISALCQWYSIEQDIIENFKHEQPQHTVNIQPFFMSKYPITQAQWDAVVSLPIVRDRLEPQPSHFKEEKNLPVESITWHQAVEFCSRISNYTGRKYRLPSEAEWEYACRGGTTTLFHCGDEIKTLVSNFNGDNNDIPLRNTYRQKTTPVNKLEGANEFGLYDMHGNVFEWCADHWHENYENAPTDGSIWLNNNNNDNYVIRGGSWDHLPVYCRSAYRTCLASNSPNRSVGFRVVYTPAYISI